MNKPSPVEVVDLIKKNNILEEENYVIRRDNTLRLVTIMAAQGVAIVFLIWLAFFHFPKTKYAWTSNAGAVCSVTPIDQAHIDPSIAGDFAQQAVVSIYSYDYLNYRRHITDAANRYFTPEFKDAFMPMFSDSKNLKSVIENTNIVSANTDGPVQLYKKGGPKGEPYSWVFQVPLQVYYTVGRKPSRPENITAYVTVSRVDPSRINPSGIAVSNIVTEQRMK